MNIRKHQDQITELYRRGEYEAAKEKFEDLISFFEETDRIDQLDYWEALLGLGSLNQKNLQDLSAAENCWKKLVSLVGSAEEAIELDSESFDVYTQGLLLLAFVQRDTGKLNDAEKNLRLLREIAVETRGETSADVKAIDGHLAALPRKN